MEISNGVRYLLGLSEGSATQSHDKASMVEGSPTLNAVLLLGIRDLHLRPALQVMDHISIHHMSVQTFNSTWEKTNRKLQKIVTLWKLNTKLQMWIWMLQIYPKNTTKIWKEDLSKHAFNRRIRWSVTVNGICTLQAEFFECQKSSRLQKFSHYPIWFFHVPLHHRDSPAIPGQDSSHGWSQNTSTHYNDLRILCLIALTVCRPPSLYISLVRKKQQLSLLWKYQYLFVFFKLNIYKNIYIILKYN